MKKTYMTPQIEEVKVNIQQLMQVDSIAMRGESAAVNGDGNYNTLSRGGSWFDDDEDY
jgi:hypothetical protein